MDTFMGRYKNVSILFAAILLQVVGLAVQVKVRRGTQDDPTSLIRVWVVTAVTPLEKGIVRVQSGASSLWHNYFYLRGVRQQNRDLQQQIQQLQLEAVRLRQDADQAHRLQTLLAFKEQFIDKTIAAQVIGSSGSEQSRTVYLDKGSEDGVRPGMAVISSAGIVGKVIEVQLTHVCQVLLISDQNSGVGTILEQSRLQGVLKGTPDGELVLDKIMAEEEVKSGDRVLTSGGDQIFPKGLPVGTIANVTRGKEFLRVTVRPAAALNHLEEVLVITQKTERQTEVAGGKSARAADILAQRLPSVPDKPAGQAEVQTTNDGETLADKPPVQAVPKPQGLSAVNSNAETKAASTGNLNKPGGSGTPKVPAATTTLGVIAKPAGASPSTGAANTASSTVPKPKPSTSVPAASSGATKTPATATKPVKPATPPATQPGTASPQTTNSGSTPQ
jgi:rod shape-determining protein MreC